MAFNINEFKGALRYGGARTSLFQVRLTNPIDQRADAVLPFMCEAASLPASTVNMIEQSYFGRPIKLPGNRTFEDWNVTIINDEDFTVRDTLEAWHNAINGLETNIRKLPSAEQALYKSTAEITQFSQDGTELRTYKMVGLWPTNISAIDMAWDNDAISKTAVTFALDYYFVSSGITGTGGGV